MDSILLVAAATMALLGGSLILSHLRARQQLHGALQRARSRWGTGAFLGPGHTLEAP